MDLVADFAGPLPVMVIAEMIGIPFEARPRFMRWSQAIVNLSTRLRGARWGALHSRARACPCGMLEYITRLVACER